MGCPKCKKSEAVAQDALKRAEAIAARAKRDSANQRQAVLNEFSRLNMMIEKKENDLLALQRDFDALCTEYQKTDKSYQKARTKLNLTTYFVSRVLYVDGRHGLYLNDRFFWANSTFGIGCNIGLNCPSYKLSTDEFLSLVWATYLLRKKEAE